MAKLEVGLSGELTTLVVSHGQVPIKKMSKVRDPKVFYYNKELYDSATGYKFGKIAKSLPLVTVALRNTANLHCSSMTEFLMDSGSYVKAKDLKSGDRLKAISFPAIVDKVTESNEAFDTYWVQGKVDNLAVYPGGVFVRCLNG